MGEPEAFVLHKQLQPISAAAFSNCLNGSQLLHSSEAEVRGAKTGVHDARLARSFTLMSSSLLATRDVPLSLLSRTPPITFTFVFYS